MSRSSSSPAAPLVRRATLADAATIGRLLHAFNREFEAPTPEPDALATRMRELLAGEDFLVLLAEPAPGAPVHGLVVLRFRPAIWTRALECYLAELYVAPAQRGHGVGRALMLAALEAAQQHGADHMDLGTSEADVAARALYESLGFVNREGGADGPLAYYYERDL